MEAELSAILLDDGGVLGAGAEELRATAAAHLNATRDLARELAAATDSAAATALLEAKAAPRNNSFTPGVPVRLTRRAQPATAEEIAARYYGDRQQGLGRWGLAMLRKQGLQYSRTMIAAEAGALPSYAVLSREEGVQ